MRFRACLLAASVAALSSPSGAQPVVGPVPVQDICPAAPDHRAELDALIARTQAAQTEGQARAISGQMWEFWADAPNEQAQAILDRGMSMRRSFDLLGALAEFDRLVDYCPDYAEGYNQRAFVSFLQQDFMTALADLGRTLDLSPRHIGALSGRALSLAALGRIAEAQLALDRALELNPWLPERHMRAPGGPLADRGKDI
ncbi:tetratricopeptide repeat protein [Chachezhania sediminis]|uniref:tetratricopeptide repeat protein n=1 Tax=Chachezhania sediminis TaxID=2599291 RepID=UPI001E62C36E|nr:tetratricopeptide repeat protein [Chachezhania sediminis]